MTRESEHGRRLRAHAAALLPTRRLRIAVALGLLASVVFAAGVSLHPGNAAFWTAFDDLGESIAPLVCTLACLVTAVRSGGRERIAWTLIGAGALAWGCGQVLWTVDEVGRGFTPVSPCLCDIGFLSSPLLIVAGVLGFVDTPSGALSRVRGAFEAALLAGGFLLPVWTLLLAPFAAAGSGSLAERLVTLAYPVCDAVGVAAVIFVLTRQRTHAHGQLAFLALGIVLLAVSDSSFWYLTTIKSYGSVDPTDSGWVIGFLLIGFAASAGTRPSSELPERERSPRRLYHRRWAVIAAPELVALAGLTTVTLDRLVVGSGHLERPVAWMTFALFGLALAHGIVVVFENHALTGHLEGRVAERTFELERRERHFAALIEGSSDIVSVIAPDLTIVSVSEGLRASYGWDPADLVGHRFDDFGGRFAALSEALGMETAPGSVRQVGWTLVDHSGRERFADSKITNLLDDPNVRGYVVNTRDVTDEKLLERELRHQAFHDQLSGLANRALFNDRAEHALDRCRRSGGRVAVMVIDLDGFKDVNDSLGHDSGDGLLRAVADRLATVVRSGDTVARLGGDEFALLMEDVDDVREALAVATAVRVALHEGILVGGTVLLITASVGIATGDGQSSTVHDLLRDADTAMYVAKNNGKDDVRAFEPWMREQARERFELLSELAGGFERGEFALHYQPLYELSTKRLEGFEALLRWRHPTRGLVPPEQFIRLAEENGVIVPLGRWVLREATRQLAEWTQVLTGEETLTMSINVSVRQIRDWRLADDVREAISDSGVAPERLVLEITETMLVHDPAEVAIVLHTLKSLGVRIAIDDFGTGYSSMSYLQDLPIDILKVDRAFVSPAGDEEPNGRKLLGAILNLADTLGLQTVAEGIEQDYQAALLDDAGCDVGQGYLWSPALSPAEATLLLERSRRKPPLPRPGLAERAPGSSIPLSTSKGLSLPAGS